MTEHTSNRPQRCGALRASLMHVQISADSAAKHFTAPEFRALALKALAEIAEYAAQALAEDDTLAAADQAKFEQHMTETYGAETARAVAELVWCENVNAPAHQGKHHVQPDCRYPHNTGEYAEPAVDVAHECGTPASGEQDTSDYPVPMTVSQRDPADPESWVFRCGAEHVSDFDTAFPAFGWQSPDYASEDDALTAAADHARAMHDGGLPNELAERAAAAERRAAERADSLIGRNVRGADDDRPVPIVGTITAITADPEWVMVSWQGPAPEFKAGAPVRVPMDELTAAGGHWAVSKAAADAAAITASGAASAPIRPR